MARLLLLTHRFPCPPDRGDRIRACHLLRFLAGHFTVDLACTDVQAPTARQQEAVAPLVGRYRCRRISPLRGTARCVWALGAGAAITPAFFYDRAMTRQLIAWHEAAPYDVVVTFCTGMIHYSGQLVRRWPRLAHVLDLVDVDSAKWQELAGASRFPRRLVYATEARRLVAYERGERVAAHAVTVVSAREAELYRRRVGRHAGLFVAGNGVDAEYFRPLPPARGPTIAFTGVLNYPPNVEAVQWFAREVLPGVRQQVPAAEFVIVGRHGGAGVRRLGLRAGVRFVGEVADVRPYLQEAAVVVAPLRVARGVQNKVLEAMACARAVVCSPAAAGGIAAQPGRELLVAEAAPQWVAAVTELLKDPGRRSELGEKGRQLVERDYSWDRQLAPMLQAIEHARKAASRQ